MAHRTDLKDHHADGVGDDVVKLARDPGALLRDGDAGRGLSLALGARRAYLRLLGLLGTLAHREPGEPADPEQQRGEEQIGRVMGGIVVGDYRGAADHDREADPGLRGVAQVAEQKRRGKPGNRGTRRDGQDSAINHRERGGDDPHRRGRGEWEAAAREQRQHDERDRGHREPQRRVRLVRERDPDGRCERRDHDQRVESVFASQLPQPVHGSNVPQALEPRLRPG